MSTTVEEFETGWEAFIDDFELETNDEWLSSLYNERHMWVPAFMRDFFWAGMKTTQQVESINSFFDGFLNRYTKLFEFPIKYALAMKKRVRDETAADRNCAKYVRILVTGFTVENFFQRLYTDNQFQEVQQECTRMMYCYCKERKMLDENTIEYSVEDRVWVVPEGKSEEVITNHIRYFSATFNKVTKEVDCECRKFRTHGIMCKHMMQILDQDLVVDIPEIYVVSRWRKDIIRKHTLVEVSYKEPNEYAASKRYSTLMADFEDICDGAAMVNNDALDMISNWLKHMRSEIDKCSLRKEAESISLSYSNVGTDSGLAAPNSPITLSTGHNQFQRFASRSGIDEHQNNDLVTDTILKDHVVNKKPRGRPKGSRNKTLAEMGFKKPNTSKKTTPRGSKGRWSDGNPKMKQAVEKKNNKVKLKSKGKMNRGKQIEININGKDTRGKRDTTLGKRVKATKLKLLDDLVPLVSLKTQVTYEPKKDLNHVPILLLTRLFILVSHKKRKSTNPINIGHGSKASSKGSKRGRM